MTIEKAMAQIVGDVSNRNTTMPFEKFEFFINMYKIDTLRDPAAHTAIFNSFEQDNNGEIYVRDFIDFFNAGLKN